MPDSINLADILSLRDSGLEFEIEQPEPLDLSPIVAELKAIVAKRADAEILSAINELTAAVKAINITVNPTDLKPVLDAVRLIKSTMPTIELPAHPPHPKFKFEVQRDARNLIENVMVLPLE